jgi:hypothetical protein
MMPWNAVISFPSNPCFRTWIIGIAPGKEDDKADDKHDERDAPALLKASGGKPEVDKCRNNHREVGDHHHRGELAHGTAPGMVAPLTRWPRARGRATPEKARNLLAPRVLATFSR